MSARAAAYRAALQNLPEAEWESYLLSLSGLPGPRGNLELAQAAADCGSRMQFQRWLAFTPQLAPANTPGEFLAFCGAVGLGRLLAEGETFWLYPLRTLASDPRWRMREAVAIALQRLGRADMQRLLAACLEWARGGLLEARAAAAAVCEPDLLRDPAHAGQVLTILERATTRLSICAHDERKGNEDFKTLRKGLGYCWSVAVAAYPDAGKKAFAALLSTPDPDVRWVLRENLKKDRLLRRDPLWVRECLEQLAKNP